MKADRSVFGNKIIASQSRDLHIKDVLGYPFGPLPWALSHGSVWKTNKAVLAGELEKSASRVEDIGKHCMHD